MPRINIAPAVRGEYTHGEYISEEVVTAQDYYIDNMEYARITVNDYWYDTIKSVQILTEENAIGFLKKKGYAVYKKVMETE